MEIECSTEEIISEIDTVFEPGYLERIGRETGLIERTWRVAEITELTFAVIGSVFAGNGISGTSVQDHMFGMFNKNISNVSILKHLKKKEFGLYLREILKNVPTMLPENKLRGWLSYFTEVNIYDSSSWKLPEDERLIEVFPGYGGDGGMAGVKIYTGFNRSKYCFPEVIVTPMKKGDTMKIFELDIKEDSLQLFDLGFYSVESAENINKKNAFYISRYQNGILLWEKGKRVNLYDLIKESVPILDREIEITEKKSLVRITAEELPEEKYQERLKHINRQAQRQRRTLKDTALQLARYNIFLTNIKWSLLPAEAISIIYSIRWQIELVYKTCKSLMKLGRDYWRDELLIENAIYAVLLSYQTIMIWAEKYRISNKGDLNELSPWILIKNYSWLFLMWLYNRLNPSIQSEDVIEKMIYRCLRYCEKDNRLKRPNSLSKAENKITYEMLNCLNST